MANYGELFHLRRRARRLTLAQAIERIQAAGYGPISASTLTGYERGRIALTQREYVAWIAALDAAEVEA